MKKLILALLLCSSNLFAADYKIDPDHSVVAFKVKHLGISSVFGKFVEFDGNFNFDPKNIKASKTAVTIQTKSIDTRQAKRDDHLKNPDFFDATKFPLMKFVSKEVKEISPDKFQLIGDLTIRDVTKPVTLDVVYGGAVTDPWGNERAAFAASTKINRKEFGLTYNKLLETGGLVVGEDVAIELEVEGIKAKA